MDVTWYLVLSALIFAIGVAGVISRRNPLVVLLCLAVGCAPVRPLTLPSLSGPEYLRFYLLAMGLAVMAAMNVIPPDALDGWAAIGELSLDGRIVPVATMDAAAEEAARLAGAAA